METFQGDTDETPEDSAGRKKSKLKSLKSRLFGRSKRTGEKTKLSQSASDITAAKGLGSEEDLAYSQAMLGSRALSHDSIFLSDSPETDAEPARVLSQENVHSKIKVLQMKLQQQKMHLGPPPMVIPVRRPEDPSSQSEDNLPHSPPDTTGEDNAFQEANFKTTFQSPMSKSAPTKPVPPTLALVLPQSVPVNTSSSTSEPPLDFSTPAQFTACLDTSAARHRMHIKPKKQRASTKKTVTVNQSKPMTDAFQVKEEEQMLSVEEQEEVETEQRKDDNYCLNLNSAAMPTQSRIGPDHVPPGATSGAHPILFPKPHILQDPLPIERPQSTLIESDIKEKSERGIQAQEKNQEKRSTSIKSELAGVSSNQLPTSSVKHMLDQQQVQVESESVKILRRPAPGSGSFHLNFNTTRYQAGERPRSGSFVEVLEQVEARQKTLKEAEERREDRKDRGGSFTVGRLRQEGTRVTPWDKRGSLKKVEPKIPAPAETEEVKEALERCGESKKDQEEEGKAAFGIKLRSTSQSVRLRSDNLTSHQSKTEEDQWEASKREDASKSVVNMADKLPANITTFSKELKMTDPSDLTDPVRHNAPITEDPQATPTDVQMASLSSKEAASALKSQEAPPATQTSEVSWMSLAMEKTRSLQQLFTSKFPKEFTGTQSAGRTQAQVQSIGQPDSAFPVEGVKPQQRVTNQLSADSSQMEAVKPSVVTMQQKISTASPAPSATTREPKIFKHTIEEQSQANMAQSISQPVQSNPWTTLSPQRSLVPAEATPSQPISNKQQPAWKFNPLKPTAADPPSVSLIPVGVSSSVPAGDKRERERDASVPNEAPPISIRKAVWSGSVSDRAAFLERRAEWTPPSGPNGVELKKPPSEMQASTESTAFAKITPPIRDTSAEGRPGGKPAESIPTKIPERPSEDKWLRKTIAKTSSPTSSPLLMQSVSESSQPSWMELAKRKSMAWNDKTMD